MSSLKDLEFLIGEWVSPEFSGEPGKGVSGSSTFSYQLNGKIVVRNSRAEFAPEPGQQKGLVHEDLIVIYQNQGEEQLRAIYFDNEGHTIRYLLSFPAAGSVVFDSEPSANNPHAQLTYISSPDRELFTEFSVALPGGQLLSHVKGSLVPMKS